MSHVIMEKGRISELIVDHEERSIVIEFESKGLKTFKMSKDTKIMNDEHFVSLPIESLAIRLPVYVYTDKTTSELLFIIIAQNEDNLFQIIDTFDEKLVSGNKMVKINDAYLNLVVNRNFETPVKDLLSHQELLVFYQVSTKSIPALINPIKIIML